jgi:hypothetical protein
MAQITESPLTTPRSCPIVLEVPNAPKKNVLDRPDRTCSCPCETCHCPDGECSCHVDQFHEDAVIEDSDDDLEDTASSKNIPNRSGDIDEFLIAAAKAEPADAIIETGGGDLEDTASSALPKKKKKNIFCRAFKAFKDWSIEHNRILINPSDKMPPLSF